MKFKIIALLLLSFTLSLITSCKNEPNAIGIDLIDSDLVYVRSLDSQTDSLLQNSGYFKKVFPLGLSFRILLGKYQDIEASTLLRFIFSLHDSIKDDILEDSILVQDAWILLTRNYLFGDTLGTIDFRTHKVNNKWSATTFTIDSLPSLNYETEDVGSSYSPTDSILTFHLTSALVLSWLKNYADTSLGSNEGIYLKPNFTTGTILGYEAFTAISTDAAKLNIVINKAGAYTDTISGFLIADVTVVDGSLPTLPSDNLAVQSGIAINGWLNFDLSSIPKGVVINSAELILTRDTITTKVGTSYNNSLRTIYITDSTSMTVTDGSDIILSYSNNTYSGNLTSYVRKWVDENKNHGIVIRSGSQTDGVELFGLKNSSAEYSLRPRLRIVYTVKEGL